MKQQRIYDLLKVSLSTIYKAKKKIYRKRAFFKEGGWGQTKNEKAFLTALATTIKKGPITSISKPATKKTEDRN